MTKRTGKLRDSRLDFDVARFDADLRRIVASRSLTLASAARDIGLDCTTLYMMRLRGAVPSGILLAAISRWAGLNPADYSIDREVGEGGGPLFGLTSSSR